MVDSEADTPSCGMAGTKYMINRFNEIDAAGPVAWVKLYSRLREAARQQEDALGLECGAALRPASVLRNRYRDVLPYDHSRVRLLEPGANASDYVNASLLHVPMARRRYILSQGPLQHTCGDFWRMVWEQDSHCIVMLNKLIENNCQKCAPYFPSSEEKSELRFGELVVRLESVEAGEHFTVRTLSLQQELPEPEGVAVADEHVNGVRERHSDGEADCARDHAANGESEPEAKRCHSSSSDQTREPVARLDSVSRRRTVKHFHYTNWPDFGVPDSTDVFLEFLFELHHNPTTESSKVDLLNLVLDLRRSRMGLIQTPEQLYFSWHAIHDALDDDKWAELLATTSSPSHSVGQSPVRRRGIDRTGGNMLPDHMRHISFDERDVLKRKKHSICALDPHPEVESISAHVYLADRVSDDEGAGDAPSTTAGVVRTLSCHSSDSPLDEQLRAAAAQTTRSRLDANPAGDAQATATSSAATATTSTPQSPPPPPQQSKRAAQLAARRKQVEQLRQHLRQSDRRAASDRLLWRAVGLGAFAAAAIGILVYWWRT